MTGSWQQAREYLARSLFRRSEGDLEFLFASARQIEQVLDDGLLVLIPCHVRDISAAVRTSEMICSQGAPVCIFVNCLENEQDEKDFKGAVEGCRELLARVERSTNSSIALVSRRHGTSCFMGAVRGMVSDAAIVAMLNRGASSYLAFVDADTLAISPHYIQSLLDTFVRSRPMMAAGPVHYGFQPNGDVSDGNGRNIPELLLADRVNQAILAAARAGEINFERRVWSEGASFAFDAFAYCQVGGFDWRLTCGEDDAFGRAMHRFNPVAFVPPVRDLECVYATRPENIEFVPGAWLVTDPRRHLKAIALGGGGTEAWDFAPFDEAPGHGLSGAKLAQEYEGHVERITDAKLLVWDRQGVPTDPWGSDRVVELVTRMLRADLRIRSPEQSASVWKRLGFAKGEPTSTAEPGTMQACGRLLRPHR